VPSSSRSRELHAFLNSLHGVFLRGMPMPVILFGVALLIKEVSLRSTAKPVDVGAPGASSADGSAGASPPAASYVSDSRR
jgi:hypothetical protein